MPKYLFDRKHEIVEAIENADQVLLFLDYDGTLVSFKDKPNDVTTTKSVKNVLRKLIKNPKFSIFMITGRELNDIKNLLDAEGASFAALHGLQMEISDGKKFVWPNAEKSRLFLEEIKEDVFSEFKGEKGIYIEDKELTLAFHYRLLPKEKIKDAAKRFREIVKKRDDKNMLEVIKGAELLEVRPKGWNKGKATEFLLKKFAKNKNSIPIYIGDDTTDEDAFDFLKNHGMTIFVSNDSGKSTSAQYWVKNPDEVLIFLKSLLDVKIKV